MSWMQRDLAGAVKAAPLLMLLAAVAVAGWMFVTKDSLPAVTQPIAYNHQKHLAVGLTCDNCHQYYERYAVAGLPKTELCMTCHAASLTDSPEEGKVRAYGDRGQEIPWIKVHNIPDHSYFSHQRHVTLGKLDCAVCHGDMTQRTTPVTRPAVSLTMGWCVSCHEQRQATTDCNACHR